MGLSSSPKSTSTSYSGSSNPAFAPYAIQGVNAVNQVYNKAAPGLDALTGRLNDQIIPGLQTQAGRSGQVAGQGMQFNSDVLSGKYLNGNPYIDQILARTRENIGNSVGGHFSTTGRYGSGTNQAVMEKQMADAENALRYQNYSTEMDRMGTAAQAGQQGNIADIAALLQALQQGSTMPFAGSESLANSLGALFSGGQEKSKSTGPNPIWSALGAAAGAAAAASDRRLKTNIVKIGEYPDGLGIYEYDIGGSRQRGVMADEVKELRPEAYLPGYFNGYDGVDYGKLGVAA